MADGAAPAGGRSLVNHPTDQKKRMTTLDNHLRKWWALRSYEQRRALKDAAEQDRMDDSTVQLLIGTECPAGPVGTQWEAQPEYAWSWPEAVRTFIVELPEVRH